MYTTLPTCAQSFAESILRQEIKLIDGETHKQSRRPRWRPTPMIEHQLDLPPFQREILSV